MAEEPNGGKRGSKEPKGGNHLVPVTKDGEVIFVHPDLVKDHIRLGWNPKG